MIAAKTSLSRSALKSGVATLAIAMLATSAHAQSTAATATAEDEGTIVVTGSLIKNPNLVSASPITVTTAESFQLRASNVAEEVLRDLPGVVPSIGSAVNNGNGGSSFVDLRGIGAERNIVLLDGDRITPASLLGAVDLNNIPLALVSRVEALTGAAVTTYGADAISGVVNFITKKDFSGVDLQLGTGLTERGDGQTFRADLTIGGNFDGGRGNAVLSVGYQKTDPIFQGQRDISLNTIESFTGGFVGSGTAIPARFTGTRVAPNGVINRTAPFTQTGVRDDGTPILAPVTGGVANGGFRQIDPATGFARPQFSTFNFNPFNIFQTPFERFNIFGQANYDISDAIEVYSRALYSKNIVNTIIAPSGSFSSPLNIPLSNPFLPAGLRNQFCAFNIAPTVTGVDAAGNPVSGQATYTPRFTQAECDAAARATSPSDPNYRTVNTAVGRRTTEVGPRTSTVETNIFDYKAGVRGKITDSLNFDIQGAYGQSDRRSTLGNYVLTSRLQQSLLSTNTTSCLPGAAAGCVPINIFGPAGSISQAAGAFISGGAASTTVRTSLAQVKGVIDGDLGFALPTASDAIGFAVGAEYRKYTASQQPDSLSQQAGELGGAGGADPVINGGYDVKEIYGELIAPLVQDKPFFENLTLEAGARYSDYKVDAPGEPTYDAFTWKVAATWETVPGLKFRGNYSRAVRAPNIGELYTPVSVGLTNLGVDPCAGAAPVANVNLRNVCLAQGAPAGSIGAIDQPTAGQVNARFPGSLALLPETASTYTFGTVIQPAFAPGFALTVDYYNIKVTDAITQQLPGDAIAACFGNLSAASATSAACTSIGRNPATGGLDGDPTTTLGLFLPLSNAGTIQTSGIDLTLAYSRDLGFAKLGINGNATYTISSKFQAGQTALNRECVGFYSVNCSFTGSIQPEFQSQLRTTLGFDSSDLSLLSRHIPATEQEPQDVIDQGPFFEGFGSIKAYDYFDLSGRFSIVENLSIVVTVSNLFDRDPPLVGNNAGSTTFNSGNTFPSTYDALGRRYAVQANLRF